MPQFSYKALHQDGTPYEGVMQETDRFGVYTAIRKEGGSIVSVTEVKASSSPLQKFLCMFGGVKEHDKVNLMRNLGAMIKAGLSLSRALSVLERQSGGSRIQSILSSVRTKIERGETLASALETFHSIFPPLVVAMIRVGEDSGSLAQSCRAISDQLEKAYILKRKIRGAFIYPAIIIVALLIIGILMRIFIVPTLTKTFEDLNVSLPPTTQLVVSTSTFLSEHTLLGIGLILTLFAGCTALVRSSFGKKGINWLLVRTPLIKGIVIEANAARTARTLASLLSAGVSIVSALENTREVLQHEEYRRIIDEAREKIQKGEGLAGVFSANPKLYPPLFSELVAVGEETGNLSAMLLELALFYEDEVEQKTKNLSTVIEPFLMLLVGGVVGFFALSMITPIYSITENI